MISESLKTKPINSLLNQIRNHGNNIIKLGYDWSNTRKHRINCFEKSKLTFFPKHEVNIILITGTKNTVGKQPYQPSEDNSGGHQVWLLIYKIQNWDCCLTQMAERFI